MRKRRSSMRPTIADVAALAGVGAITVSRALSSPDKVSERLRGKITKAIQDLGYVPDLNARALASSRTDLIAVLVPSLSQSIFSDVIRGIYDGRGDSRLRIELANTRYSPDLEHQLVVEALRHSPAAMIISGTEQLPQTRKLLEAARCPIVQIMDLTDDPIQKVVGFSHELAGYEMGRHLVASGYHKIGFFSGWMNLRARQRMLGLQLALEEANLFDPGLFIQCGKGGPEVAAIGDRSETPFSSPMMGRRMTLEMLDRRPDLEAVFCVNDVLSLGVLFACIERGVDVPGRMGIAGFNDFDYMAAATPSLTSVRIHRWKCGFEAMSSVRAQLDGAPMGEPVVDLGFEIMARESTARQAGGVRG